MLSIIILLLFLYAFYTGYRRGLALQLFYLGGYIVSYLFAIRFYQTLGRNLELWIPFPSPTLDTNMIFFDQATSFLLARPFYAGAAFILILLGCYILVRFLGIFVRKLNKVVILGKINQLLGGAGNLVITYIAVFLVLYLASFIPMNNVQNMLSNDRLARTMIERTPLFTNSTHRLWITDIIGNEATNE